MKSEELFQFWKNCSDERVVREEAVREQAVREDLAETDDNLRNCLKGAVGLTDWKKINDEAKCLSELFPLSTCKTTVEQQKLGFFEHSNNVTDAQICSVSKDEESAKFIYEAVNYIDAFLFKKPNMKIFNDN